MFLNPLELAEIWGPRWVRLTVSIEFWIGADAKQRYVRRELEHLRVDLVPERAELDAALKRAMPLVRKAAETLKASDLVERYPSGAPPRRTAAHAPRSPRRRTKPKSRDLSGAVKALNPLALTPKALGQLEKALDAAEDAARDLRKELGRNEGTKARDLERSIKNSRKNLQKAVRRLSKDMESELRTQRRARTGSGATTSSVRRRTAARPTERRVAAKTTGKRN